MNRPRYQHGFFSRHQRKKGPEVWVYRWRDIDAKGKPKMRALVIGSAKQYPTETAAWKAVSTLRLDVNHHSSRPEGLPETFEQLVEHYRLIELDLEKESERKVRQTKQTYAVYLNARIVPRWGGYRLREIKAVAVERWLGSIDDLSNGTKAKIKGIMSEVFQHAIRYSWLNDGENPIFAVRQSTKRKRVTEPLEVTEFRALMLELPQKMRVIGSWLLQQGCVSAKSWASSGWTSTRRLCRWKSPGRPLRGIFAHFPNKSGAIYGETLITYCRPKRRAGFTLDI